MLRCLHWRYLLRNPSQRPYSASAVGPELSISEEAKNMPFHQQRKEDAAELELAENSLERSKMVAAAFASLKEISLKTHKRLSPSVIDLKVVQAKDVDSLLEVAEESYISRYHALKIVSRLAEWASRGHIKLSDFEMDSRFIKLCRILGRNKRDEETGDLSLVLKITGDDQAAKLISSVSLSQMVKVMSSLRSKGRRSTPLLRSLSFNIGRSTEQLNIKEAADVLYACAMLNFPDEVLIEKVLVDIRSCLENLKNPSVFSSVLTSIGRLKYRNVDMLEDLCGWMIKNKQLCRLQDFISALLTFANVNYVPQNFDNLYKIVETNLCLTKVNNLHTWLDIVWSLVFMNKATDSHISSVLDEEFITRILKDPSEGSSQVVTKLKLLNINGVAKLKGNQYKGGVLLDEKERRCSNIFDVSLARTKEKDVFVQSVVATLSSLLPSQSYLNADVNTNMGFLIDGEFYVNRRLKFVHPDEGCKASSTECAKVALMSYTYHDMCRGCHNELTGINQLMFRLTEMLGYKVLTVPYTEYNPKSEIFVRTKYIERRLKDLLNDSFAVP